MSSALPSLKWAACVDGSYRLSTPPGPILRNISLLLLCVVCCVLCVVVVVVVVVVVAFAEVRWPWT